MHMEQSCFYYLEVVPYHIDTYFYETPVGSLTALFHSSAIAMTNLRASCEGFQPMKMLLC